LCCSMRTSNKQAEPRISLKFRVEIMFNVDDLVTPSIPNQF